MAEFRRGVVPTDASGRQILLRHDTPTGPPGFQPGSPTLGLAGGNPFDTRGGGGGGGMPPTDAFGRVINRDPPPRTTTNPNQPYADYYANQYANAASVTQPQLSSQVGFRPEDYERYRGGDEDNYQIDWSSPETDLQRTARIHVENLASQGLYNTGRGLQRLSDNSFVATPPPATPQLPADPGQPYGQPQPRYSNTPRPELLPLRMGNYGNPNYSGAQPGSYDPNTQRPWMPTPDYIPAGPRPWMPQQDQSQINSLINSLIGNMGGNPYGFPGQATGVPSGGGYGNPNGPGVNGRPITIADLFAGGNMPYIPSSTGSPYGGGSLRFTGHNNPGMPLSNGYSLNGQMNASSPFQTLPFSMENLASLLGNMNYGSGSSAPPAGVFPGQAFGSPQGVWGNYGQGGGGGGNPWSTASQSNPYPMNYNTTPAPRTPAPAAPTTSAPRQQMPSFNFWR